MNNLSNSKETIRTVDEVCVKITESIQAIGFGVLTRIDFDQKIQEKLNEKIQSCVILGPQSTTFKSASIYSYIS